jgi:hypothetical protein
MPHETVSQTSVYCNNIHEEHWEGPGQLPVRIWFVEEILWDKLMSWNKICWPDILQMTVQWIIKGHIKVGFCHLRRSQERLHRQCGVVLA